MAMVVGMPCGKCITCGKQATVLILGNPYCYKCGKPHVHEAVEVAAKELKRNIHGKQA